MTTSGSVQARLPRQSAQRLAPALWALLLLFVLRVTGQLVVAARQPTWLPPMDEWMSGLVPYPQLVITQAAIIVLLSWTCVQFSRGHGLLVRPSRRLGKGARVFGSLYLGSMLLRYVVRMALCPEERWFGGSIPIVFHCVLATYVLLFARHHATQARGVASDQFADQAC